MPCLLECRHVLIHQDRVLRFIKLKEGLLLGQHLNFLLVWIISDLILRATLAIKAIPGVACNGIALSSLFQLRVAIWRLIGQPWCIVRNVLVYMRSLCLICCILYIIVHHTERLYVNVRLKLSCRHGII